MTIQAGITGPPTTAHQALRVWTDRPGHGPPDVRHAASGLPLGKLTIRKIPEGAATGGTGLPREVFEIAGAPANSELSVSLGGETCHVRTLPEPGEELRLLFGSCYYRRSDRGRLARAFEQLRPGDRPHVRIHGGDQLYLDAERLDASRSVLERTVAIYDEYWNDPSYGAFLRGGVSLFTADDHEYWNDYPFSVAHLRRSWSDQWRAHADAADRARRAYQSLGHPGGSDYFALELGPISLFLTDTRSRRGDGRGRGPRRLFDDAQAAALRAWSRSLDRPGVLVTAMPLFQPARKTSLFGLVTTDHNLLAYERDARTIWDAVEEAPHDIVVLGGDIHQGRLGAWQDPVRPGGPRRFELVASPLSILTWFTGRPEPEPPPRVRVGGRVRRIDHPYWGVADTDMFALLRFRPLPTGRIRARFELRAVGDPLGVPIAISDYARAPSGAIVRAPRPEGRVPCAVDVTLG